MRPWRLSLFARADDDVGDSTAAPAGAGRRTRGDVRQCVWAVPRPRGSRRSGSALVPMTRDANEVLAIVREGIGQMPPISTREVTDEQVVHIVDSDRLNVADEPRSGAWLVRTAFTLPQFPTEWHSRLASSPGVTMRTTGRRPTVWRR